MIKDETAMESQTINKKTLSEYVKICIKNILQPETRKWWKIQTILDNDWIKMNQMLAEMNNQESIALENVFNSNKTSNQNYLKKIKANRSETQHILNDQMPKFFSTLQKNESISNIDEGNSYTET